jgi:Reverse transcriptase (RNA-dependent DNA polymerase)
MSYELKQIKEAYIKLKTYIYYDNTDLLLRRKLVEFESDRTKEDIVSQLLASNKPYIGIKEISKMSISQKVEAKLEQLTDALNNYHKQPTFVDFFLNHIKVSFYPKSFQKEESEKNFITNKRIDDGGYKIDRVTAFIDASIEIHIISVLWILEYGKNYELQLSDNCLGNRLLLNINEEKIVQGSSLFKPYFKQYQKWRDESVEVAQNIIRKKKNVLFLNLDIKDYFHSVRMPTSKLFSGRKYKGASFQSDYNLEEIFLKIHLRYTEQVADQYSVPYKFINEIKSENTDEIEEVVLPIGLLSSYVLANYYLKEFDNSLLQKIKPAYYGRYVDDILIVLEAPKTGFTEDDIFEELKFSFADYKLKINSSKNKNESVSFAESDLTNLERFVLQNFSPLIKLVDKPSFFESPIENNKKERYFKLTGYESLFCQSEKSLVYYFDHEESDLVIDKLKKELNERTSEFRDFPDEGEDDNAFEESAYHLQYDGTEGKIRTLKDYKENRYGLTVYLANRIFSALRHEKKITEKEKDQVLKFFRGLNCISFYRLWERIFTFFLVNKQAEAYVEFYLHCVEQIESIKKNVHQTNVTSEIIAGTMIDYLDCAHEITLSLNPKFIKMTQDAARNFEFNSNKIKSSMPTFWMQFEPTLSTSYWVIRFRETNLIRHHYVIHPLLNYTNKSRDGSIDLTALDFDIQKYCLNDELLKNSPRSVKFSECCLAIALTEISNFKNQSNESFDGYACTNILNFKNKKKESNELDDNFDPSMIEEEVFYLDDAYTLYEKSNSNHIAAYLFEEKNFKEKFYSRKKSPFIYDEVNPINVQEFTIKTAKNYLAEPKIAFANTEVEQTNIISSIRGKPNLELERYQKLSIILRKARLEKSDILLFPECFIPLNLLSSLVRYSEKNECLTITGLEHLVIEKAAFNFIITILPVEVNGIKDAVVVFRLKNHYAHGEASLITGNHLDVPKPVPYRYDIFNWRNVYFSSFYCFELCNSLHRSLMKGKIDLLVGVEWNKDTNYFSNIVESGSRDLHAYIAQVNTSQYGDTRLTQPVETARQDILRLKGGKNDAILVAPIDIPKLREFQRQRYSITNIKGEFKPLPPDFLLLDVMKRINNENVL